MNRTYKDIVVVGGSYVGLRTAQELTHIVPATHRVLLLERNSHFNHLFSFPRFSVLPGYECKAFIPFSGLFSQSPGQNMHKVINANVTKITPSQVYLDRKWEGSEMINFDYLAIATGTQLTAPAMMNTCDKVSSTQYLRQHQKQVKSAQNVAVIGGGAVGVQIASDLKELYPSKVVTLIHSRDQLLKRFHPELHRIVSERLEQLDVRLKLGSRVIVPPGGFNNDGKPFEVHFSNGESITADFVIMATGQTPNNFILRSLPQVSNESLVNPLNGLIRVRPTMQLRDMVYSNIFAVGDVADTGAAKAARPGYAQAEVAAKNINALIEGQVPLETLKITPAAIHLSVGLRYNVAFRNPEPGQYQPWPSCKVKHDGQDDLNVEKWWQRLNVTVNDPKEYNL